MSAWSYSGTTGTFLRILLPVLASVCAFASDLKPTVVLNSTTNQVGQYQALHFTLEVSASYTNPFNPEEVDLTLQLTSPSGATIHLPAFWCQQYERQQLGGDRRNDWVYPVGQPGWRARFAPSDPGRYLAVAVLKEARGTARSESVRFQCLPSQRKGFLRVSKKDSRFFELSSGQPFFAIGQNLAFIGSQQYVSLSKAEAIFGELAANGANYLRIWTCCEDWAMAIEARKSAFGRSWDWRPPIVAAPGVEASGRKCLKLSADKNTIRVDPSHPVAVRPATRYVFSSKARLDPAVSLKLDVDGKQSEASLVPGRDPDWIEFKLEFETAAGQLWLGGLNLHSEGQGAAWISDLSLREAGGGSELLWEADVNRPILGQYNPLDCFMLDELVAAAEKQGILLQLCFLTRDLYMSRLKDPASPQYDHAIADARKALRYAIARWGYSTSVAAWEYWNEMDPGLPTDHFYTALGEFLEQADPYRHLRTTSTWGPSSKDCRHAKLDIADVHFYLRPADKDRLEDEVDAVLERTRWLREQAPRKPAHLGEFGLANDKWQPTVEMNRSREIVDFHNALWASALSGASGTALFWWWDRLDRRAPYTQYGPLSRFLATVPWTSGDLGALSATCSEPRLRTVGLQTKDQAWLWLFDRESSWRKIVVDQTPAGPVSNANLELKGLSAGTYQIQWYDTYQGRIFSELTGTAENGVLRLAIPDFRRDLACRVARQRQ